MNTTDYIMNKYGLRRNYFEISNTDRSNLAELFHELDFKIIVEVGVASGKYSSVLCQKNPQAKIYGIDPFIPYKGYRDYQLKSTVDKLHQEATDLLTPYSNYTFIRKFSMDALSDFEDESIDAVYIDANHEDPWVSDDIREWTKKVRTGGIVSGHDYVNMAKNPRVAVKKAVNNYTLEHGKDLFIWGLEAKALGLRRENTRSWMFIR